MRIKINKELLIGAVGALRERGNTSNLSHKLGRNRRRIWVFTFNNYEDTDIGAVAQAFLDMNCKKYCFQEEIGEEKGTPHLQGVVQFYNEIEFNVIIKINKKIQWKPPRKSLLHNIKYCSKFRTRKPGTVPYRYNVSNNEMANDGCGLARLTYDEQLDWLRKGLDEYMKPTQEEIEAEGRARNAQDVRSWDLYYWKKDEELRLRNKLLESLEE